MRAPPPSSRSPPCPPVPIPPARNQNPLPISICTSTSMEQSGVQTSTEHAEPPDGGEDRLSALPDDVLVHILQCLDTTAEAARTSVLARRWRRLGLLLTELCFESHPDGDRIRELLDVPGAPQLRHIYATTKGAAADSATAWLPAAARRLAGGLFYRNTAADLQNEEEEEARRAGDVQLPCFENATTIKLNLRLLGLVLPSVGVFTRLTDLALRSVHFRGPCELGNVVSSPRCPCLQRLSIGYSLGLHNLSIHSESLLQMELRQCYLLQLTIVTPILQKLSVIFDHPSESVVITAPQIVSLVWMASYDPRYVHLGNLGQLQELETKRLLVYGDQSNRENNHHCLRLLQQFRVVHNLRLFLLYCQDICHSQYLLGDITVLPQISFLRLDLHSYGHAFGASLFHLLRMCITLRRLSLVLYAHSYLEVEPVCPSGCICDQPENWKADELVLGNLEDVCIVGLRGAEHEVAFLQRLLGWATVLKTLRITFFSEMTDGKIEEFSEALAGFCRPETRIQISTRDDR